MENKRGQGIFLGIVGVATLVVAIIGATFAYFSASISGSNNVELQAYDFDADLDITMLSDEADHKLIPLLPDGPAKLEDGNDNPNYTSGSNAYLLAAVNDTSGEGVCVDENGYQVCELVQATFTNNGTTPISLTGELTATVNGFSQLKVVELSKDTGGTYSVIGTAQPAPTANAKPGTPLSTASVDITGSDDGNTTVKYFAIYLNDTGSPQESEMGQQFYGTFTYTSAIGGDKLSGKFTIN